MNPGYPGCWSPHPWQGEATRSFLLFTGPWSPAGLFEEILRGLPGGLVPMLRASTCTLACRIEEGEACPPSLPLLAYQ